MNLAFGPALGVFTKSKMLYRFASEGQFKSEQIEPTLRRYTFSYKPESEEQLLGKPIDVLADIEQLGINAKGFLEMVSSSPSLSHTQSQRLGKAGAVLSFTLFVNRVPATSVKGQVKPTGALTMGEMSMNVAQAFSTIPRAYGSVASR